MHNLTHALACSLMSTHLHPQEHSCTLLHANGETDKYKHTNVTIYVSTSTYTTYAFACTHAHMQVCIHAYRQAALPGDRKPVGDLTRLSFNPENNLMTNHKHELKMLTPKQIPKQICKTSLTIKHTPTRQTHTSTSLRT